MRKIWKFSLFTIAFLSAGVSLAQTGPALTPLSTELTPQLFKLENCETSPLNSLEKDAYPFDGNVLKEGVSSPANFLRGVCLFHRNTDDIITQEKAIERLQKASTEGLFSSQRNVAALFEGLAHCRVATALYSSSSGGFKASPQTTADMDEDVKLKLDKAIKLKEQHQFCMHRSMAKENFADIDWAGLNLSYTEKGKLTLTTHVNNMVECGKTLLSSGFDSYCGEITPIAQQDVADIAEKSAESVINQYIGDPEGNVDDPSLPPLAGMMARKIAMTKATLESSKDDFSRLKASNIELDKSYKDILGLYGSMNEGILTPSPTKFPGRVGVLYEDYQIGLAKAQTLRQLIENWKKGYCTYKGEDRCKLLEKQTALLSEQKNYLFGSKQESGVVADLDTMVQRITKIEANSVEPNKKLTQSMCALYYCEVRLRSPSKFSKTCSASIGMTTDYLYTLNPLCDKPAAIPGEKPSVQGVLKANLDQKEVSRNLPDLCREAEFDTSENLYLKAASLSEGQRSTCIKKYVDSTLLKEMGL